MNPINSEKSEGVRLRNRAEDEVGLPKLGSFYEQSLLEQQYQVLFLIYNIRKPLSSFPNHSYWYKSRFSMQLQRKDRSRSSQRLPRLLLSFLIDHLLLFIRGIPVGLGRLA